MYIQGNLQVVFDALYTIGAIDPVLKADWEVINREMEKNPHKLKTICQEINGCRGDVKMITDLLRNSEMKTVEFLALEVAREFSEFQDRKQLH